MMKYINEAGWDRVGRVVLGIVLLALGWSGAVDGAWGAFLKVIGFVPLATGLAGWCPLYAVFRFRTNGTAEDRELAGTV